MPPAPKVTTIMQVQVDNTPLRQHPVLKGGHFQTSGGELKAFSELSKEPLRDINPLNLYNKSEKQHPKAFIVPPDNFLEVKEFGAESSKHSADLDALQQKLFDGIMQVP